MDFLHWKFGELIDVAKNQNFLEFIWDNKYWIPLRFYKVLASSIEMEHIFMLIIHAALMIFTFAFCVAYVGTNKKKSVLKNIMVVLLSVITWYIVYLIMQIPILLHFYHYLREEPQTSFYILLSACVVVGVIIYSVCASKEKQQEERYKKRIRKEKMTVLDVDYVGEVCVENSRTSLVPVGNVTVPINHSSTTTYNCYYSLILKDSEKRIYRAALYKENTGVKQGDVIKITKLTKSQIRNCNFVIDEFEII